MDYVGQTLLDKRITQATTALDAAVEALGSGSEAYADLIKSARSVLELRDSVALSNIASELRAANASAFEAAATAFDNASKIAAKYEVNSWSR